MRPAVGVAGVAALAFLALAAPAVPPAWAAEAPVLRIPWSLPECAMAVAFVEVDPEGLAALLPPGFAPAFEGPLGRPQVLVEFAECGRAAYGNWEVPVRPPPALGREGAAGHYVKFDTLVQDPATREALAAWGVPARAGVARVGPAAPLAPLAFAAEMHMAGLGAFRLDFTTTGPAGVAADFPFLEFTPVPGGGLATWDVALRDLALAPGRGVLALPPGSALAALAGAERGPVDVLAGGWSALDGTVAAPGGGEVAFAVGRTPAAAAGIAAVVAGGAAGAGVLWKVLRWLWPVVAYSRLTPAAALRHPRRQALLARVRDHPGITPRELRRATGLAPGVLAHHLALLEHHGHVVRRRQGLRVHLFAAGVRPAAEQVLPPERARVLARIRERPGAAQRALARDLGLSRWAVAHHARRLAGAGLVRVCAEGRERRHWPAERGPGPG